MGSLGLHPLLFAASLGRRGSGTGERKACDDCAADRGERRYRRVRSKRHAYTKVQELIARLGADGWYQARQKGSHRQYRHPTKQGTVTVAGKPSVEVPPGTLNSILKQAGLKK